MTAPDIVVYAGSTGAPGIDDLTPGRMIATAVGRADGALILDPLSFPWEMFERPPRCPVGVNVTACTDADLRALLPAFDCLLASDVLLGERAVVDDVCHALGLPSLWADPDLDFAAYAASAATAKLCDLEEHLIVSDLAREPELVIVSVSGADVRSARTGVDELADRIRLDHGGLDGADLDSVWGVRSSPGAPLERAVLAFRSSQTVAT